MKTIYKLSLISLLLTVCALQTNEQLPEPKAEKIPLSEEAKTANTVNAAFTRGAAFTFAACVAADCISSVTAPNAVLTPIDTIALASLIVGSGIGYLHYLDKKDLKENRVRKNPRTQSKPLKALVISAGLTPLLFSKSSVGAAMRTVLASTGEALLQAGDYITGCMITGLSR